MSSNTLLNRKNCDIGVGNITGDWTSVCVAITGSADLCDGDDAVGAGGGGSSVWFDDGIYLHTNDSYAPSVNITSNLIFGGWISGDIGCGNLTGATSNLCTLVDTNTFNSSADIQAVVSATYIYGLGFYSTANYTIGNYQLEASAYKNANFTAQYNAITSRYATANFTADHSTATHSYIGNCSGKNCDIGWGNLTSVPAGFADGVDDVGAGSGNCSVDASCSLVTYDSETSTWDKDLSDDLNTTTQFAGDVSGTYDATVVADDSHNHVYSNIDAMTEANLYTILSDVSQFWENGDSVTGCIGANEAYGAGWNGDTSVPEKDDVYDAGFLQNIVTDTTPQLGGNLDTQNLNVTGVQCITFNSGGWICGG